MANRKKSHKNSDDESDEDEREDDVVRYFSSYSFLHRFKVL